jgi:phosphoserine aminotransferase
MCQPDQTAFRAPPPRARTLKEVETRYSDGHPVMKGSLVPPSGVQVKNFSPGPTSLPAAVESEIKDLFSAERMCSMYLSHRSPEFVDILTNTKELCRKAMMIPDNYEILFMHGGGHGQFAAVPLNLCTGQSDKAAYLVNGTWSHRAAQEAEKYCTPIVISSQNDDGTYTSNPSLDNIDNDCKYIYLCSNETVNGIEWHRLPKLGPESPPLVVDASSDFSTKPVEWAKSNVGVLYACASKNIGHPGITMVVIRKDLIGNCNPFCPGILCYHTNARENNLWNTIATFNVEVVGIFMKWMIRQGGVDEMEYRSIAKSEMMYNIIDRSNGFYTTPLENKRLRSRMNVPFTVAYGDEDLTKEFLVQLWEKGIVGLRTLTPFGVGKYLRASLYNGVPLENVKQLVCFMDEFMNANMYRMQR